MPKAIQKCIPFIGLFLLLVILSACGDSGSDGDFSSSLSQETATPINFDLDVGDTEAIAIYLLKRGCLGPFRHSTYPIPEETFNVCVETLHNIGELDGINFFDAGDFLRRIYNRIQVGLASGITPEFWNALLEAWLAATQSNPAAP